MTLRHLTETGVEAVLDRAVRRGQLSRGAADAILAAEEAESAAVAAPARRRVSATAEAIGYVGGTLAMIGLVVLAGRFWSDMAQAVRLGLLGGVAVLLIVVGLFLRDEDDPVIWRLRGFLWLLAVGAVAGFAAALAVDTFGWEGEPVAIAIGASVATVSALLWHRRDRPAQHLTTLIGLLLAAGAVAGWVDGAAAVGISMMVIGLLWAVSGRTGALPPRYAALALGVSALSIGPAVTFGTWHKQAPLIGLAVAVPLIIVGSVSGEFLVTAAGVLGVMGYLPFTLAQWFGRRVGPPVVLLASGALLLLVMMILLRRGRRERSSRTGSRRRRLHVPHHHAGAAS